MFQALEDPSVLAEVPHHQADHQLAHTKSVPEINIRDQEDIRQDYVIQIYYVIALKPFIVLKVPAIFARI